MGNDDKETIIIERRRSGWTSTWNRPWHGVSATLRLTVPLRKKEQHSYDPTSTAMHPPSHAKPWYRCGAMRSLGISLGTDLEATTHTFS